MPTIVTETIGTDSRDYSTLTAWEGATDNDLVAADEIRVGEMYDDSDFTTGITIAGATADSTRYRRLEAASGEEYDPVTNTGALNTAATSPCAVDDAFTRLMGFGLIGTGTSQSTMVSIRAIETLWFAVFADISATENTFSSCWENTSSSEQSYLYNCIGHGGDWCFNLRNDGADALNCIGDGQKGGLYSVGRTFHFQNNGNITNCIAIRGDSNDFFGNSTESFNASEDTTASGTGSIDFQDPALLFSDHTANDYRPASASSNTVDAGTDLSGTFTESFEPGVDHDSASSGWEMGCYDDSAIPAGVPDIASLKNVTNTLLRM